MTSSKFKIVSGGQTGVDQWALGWAREHGFETGGFAPLGWQTELGPDPVTLGCYGLVQWGQPGYPARTRANVKHSDVTLWIGPGDSSGFRCTQGASILYQKRFINVIMAGIPYTRSLISQENYQTINVAGPRGSKAMPGLQQEVHGYLRAVLL